MNPLITRAFVLGALHALEPGHGKTFLGAYIAGNKVRPANLMSIGLSMAISHTLVLILIGLVIGYLFPASLNSGIQAAIEILAPLSIIAIGIYLYKKQPKKVCSCCEHGHKHHHEQKATRSAILVGFAGGLLPCPSAVAAFTFSGSENGFQQSWKYVLVYVMGFVCLMMLLSLVLLLVKDKISGLYDHRLGKNIQRFSSVAIIAIGCVYFFKEVIHHLILPNLSSFH